MPLVSNALDGIKNKADEQQQDAAPEIVSIGPTTRRLAKVPEPVGGINRRRNGRPVATQLLGDVQRRVCVVVQVEICKFKIINI